MQEYVHDTLSNCKAYVDRYEVLCLLLSLLPCPAAVDSELFPYLLVNIGSGVSIIRVDGPGEDEYCRVSGSSVGGGTFWGLCRLLTGRRDFDEMLELSMQGNNANVSRMQYS